MSKIFRLHKGGSDSIIDWMPVNGHLSETLINTIEDPAGENAKKQITSIPSPFARMDLIRTAFRYIVAKKAIDGDTIYHRIISEVLDVAEIFVNADSLQSKIEIIPWDAGITKSGDSILVSDTSDLGKLIRSSNPKHRLYAETLRMFLLQDKDAYNFADLKRVFLINYKAGPERMNIIGGTSPATLFFSSANNDICMYANISFGEHKIFDAKNYYSIAKRSDDFIKYIYALRQSIPNFAGRFKDVDDYLSLAYTQAAFPQHIKEEIREFTNHTYANEYEDLSLGANEGYKVEVLGHTLKGYRPKNNLDSDFEISSAIQVAGGGKVPLVLPNEPFNEPLNYVNGKWRIEYKAPYYDARNINERTLPQQDHLVYPYLTVSDFLEPYIIRVPYPINKDMYFNGNFNEKNYGYVLPIKKELFRYFSIDKVRSRMPDGKNFFELVKQAGESVEAILRIPIKNGSYIKFSRLYTLNQLQDAIQQPNEKDNKGIIVQYNFGLSVYPFLKTGSDDLADYRVVLIDCDATDIRTKNNNYKIHLYKEGNVGRIIDTEVSNSKTRRRSDKSEDFVTSLYKVHNEEFDIIEIEPNAFSKGLMIPSFKLHRSGSDVYTFAIDFGTTNTHIEFRKNGGEPMPFEISEADIQVASSHVNNAETISLLKNRREGDTSFGLNLINIAELLPKEFLPETIGKNSLASFPIRTVISDSTDLDMSATTYALADFNSPFVYEKQIMPPNSNITADLKWANYKKSVSDQKRLQAFIEKVVILIRNKVIRNNGNLAKTKIIWFYPSSMSVNRRDSLERMWKEYAQKYLGEGCIPLKLSESVAPFYYITQKEGVLAYDKPVVGIDIGGGTTDIIIYIDNKPIYLTSFRFAANAIFGDYNNGMGNNGFYKKYRDKIHDLLKKSNAQELTFVLEQIEDLHSKTTELVSFFFSLENNKLLKANNVSISYNKMLSEDENAKVVFIMFYAAIVYHLASLMKALGLDAPSVIYFSGTGSKVVNILDTNIALNNASEYAGVIFSSVYDKEVKTIKVQQSKLSKEITCKGGLYCNDFTVNTEDIKTVLLGDKEKTIIHKEPLIGEHLTYDQLTNPMVDSVKAEVESFIDKFFEWNTKFSYNNKFGAQTKNFPELKTTCKTNIMNFLKKGMEQTAEEIEEKRNEAIDEPLFFFPLTGILNELSKAIK